MHAVGGLRLVMLTRDVQATGFGCDHQIAHAISDGVLTCAADEHCQSQAHGMPNKHLHGIRIQGFMCVHTS